MLGYITLVRFEGSDDFNSGEHREQHTSCHAPRCPARPTFAGCIHIELRLFLCKRLADSSLAQFCLLAGSEEAAEGLNSVQAVLARQLML